MRGNHKHTKIWTGEGGGGGGNSAQGEDWLLMVWAHLSENTLHPALRVSHARSRDGHALGKGVCVRTSVGSREKTHWTLTK